MKVTTFAKRTVIFTCKSKLHFNTYYVDIIESESIRLTCLLCGQFLKVSTLSSLVLVFRKLPTYVWVCQVQVCSIVYIPILRIQLIIHHIIEWNQDLDTLS